MARRQRLGVSSTEPWPHMSRSPALRCLEDLQRFPHLHSVYGRGVGLLHHVGTELSLSLSLRFIEF